jgi:phosphoglycolate phosphatase
LFDLDGTLVDSFPAIRASVNHVRAAYGLKPLSLLAVKRAVGNGLTRLLEITCPNGDPEADADRFIRHHAEVLKDGTKLLPGVRRTLAVLAERGCKMAVCSNKPVELSRQLLAEAGMDHFFAATLGPESVPRRKPAPDMLLEALRQLSVHAAESLYVGDMTIDIETARAAGVPVWVVPTGSQDRATLEAAGPDRVLVKFSELLDDQSRVADSGIPLGPSS